jgi:hypothetical protein
MLDTEAIVSTTTLVCHLSHAELLAHKACTYGHEGWVFDSGF